MSESSAGTTKNLSLVKTTKALKKHQAFGTLVDEIVKICQKIPNLETMKNSIDIVEYVCNLIENASYNNKNGKLEKQKIALTVLTKLFPSFNNEADVARIKSMIDYLCANGNIKKLSSVVTTGKNIVSWVRKKLA